ncbi:UNVERIFIED_CONTAM: hypothetical protein FKN15_063011 [Acipenser sinensis]
MAHPEQDCERRFRAAVGVVHSLPKNAVSDKYSQTQNVPQLPCGKALYNYEGKEPGDLKFNKGDIIILRRKVDENWYHGELNGSHGFLPASYIHCIKPLLQTPPQGKALYDFEVKDKDQDKDCLTFTKDSSSFAGTSTIAGVPPRIAAASGDQGTAVKVQLPLNIYLALYAYKPQKTDELELRKGEMYRVTEKCQDGWFKGTSLRTGMSGVFPGNYVTPVSSDVVQSAGLTQKFSQTLKQDLNPISGNGKKEKKGGLLKLLSGASAKKKSRSSPSVSPTHEPQPQAAAEAPIQGAMGPEVSSVLNHGRAGSCPIESEMQGAMGIEPLHKKSGSLDLNFSVSPPARQPCSSMVALRPEPKPLSRERYRVIVPYPPQSEAEIELKEGDVVFVLKKREDGWYKGTLQRSGRTGLFPGSFVESF